MAVTRIFVEKKPGYDVEAKQLCAELREALQAHGLQSVRILQRYDVENLPAETLEAARGVIFSEPNIDTLYEENPPTLSGWVFAVEYLPGQYDQRADSTAQCLQLLTQSQRTAVACAKVYALEGDVDAELFTRIRGQLINPVEAREASMDKPDTLAPDLPPPQDVPVVEGFIGYSAKKLASTVKKLGMAMTADDLEFCQAYFRDEEHRDPTMTELRAIDTYWSDHCRHTTFLTAIDEVKIANSRYSEPINRAWKRYTETREAVHGPKQKDVSLMDMATLGMKALRAQGKLDDLDISEEINACSIVVEAQVDGVRQPWLVMFKNETHNHPTEIEGFGGAATSLGGAIRDPLSGRSYVYQAMRISGSGDPRTPYGQTRPGKLPQRRITTTAAHGFSSYGNQIGLAAGKVQEVYHPGFVAKRLELGAVIAATPKANVRREEPAPGDVVLLIGGRTGRDGCGGATGSSKAHDAESLTSCGAEVQKGNPPTERCLQRLFLNPDFSKRVKRCNDFGAGGVCVAVGELAPGLEIDLDAVPKKYDGLDGTELAISESQERMAVVIDIRDVAVMMRLASAENLECTPVAQVTQEPRLRMRWHGGNIVDIARSFLDTNGVTQHAKAKVIAPDAEHPYPLTLPEAVKPGARAEENWLRMLGDLNVCSQRGLVERFDGSIGAGTVIAPYGGLHRGTPNEAMAALLPVPGITTTMTLMAHGYDPALASWSPYHGAVYAIIEAIAKVVAAGGDAATCRLTLQEYFARTDKDPARWGAPLAAMLGALDAQLAMETPAIGGKDSMSGTFEDISVPPTLVAFAVAVEDVLRVVTPELKGANHVLARLAVPRDAALLPDYGKLRAAYDAVHVAMRKRQILSAHTVGHGGLATAISRMAFGNRVGVVLDVPATEESLFLPDWGGLVLELADGMADALMHGANAIPGLTIIGRTQAEPVFQCGPNHGSFKLAIADALAAWEAPLTSVFPTQAHAQAAPPPPFAPHTQRGQAKARIRTARPRVCIPCFPGTNCELDSAHAFERAGANAEVILLRNLTPHAITESVKQLAEGIKRAQIIMLPGGFSAGDEPDGSGKFIATALRNPRIAEAISDLLEHRDGLMLGICNGFQALIKLGLLPYGSMRVLGENDPTLTFNTLGRHVATHVHTVVSSVKSPWMAGVNAGDVHSIAISHGEGRFLCDEAQLKALQSAGQIVTQYCEADGTPAMRIPANPNGSVWAIEGICSPDGRILGKMGHSERVGSGVAVNIPGEKDQKLFASGVAYFA